MANKGTRLRGYKRTQSKAEEKGRRGRPGAAQPVNCGCCYNEEQVSSEVWSSQTASCAGGQAYRDLRPEVVFLVVAEAFFALTGAFFLSASAFFGLPLAFFSFSSAAGAAFLAGRPTAFFGLVALALVALALVEAAALGLALGLSPERVFLGRGAAFLSAWDDCHSLMRSLGALAAGSQVGE